MSGKRAIVAIGVQKIPGGLKIYGYQRSDRGTRYMAGAREVLWGVKSAGAFKTAKLEAINSILAGVEQTPS